MTANPYVENAAPNVAVARADSALQHGAGEMGPRPLPLFLSLVREHGLTAPAEAQRALRGLRKIQAMRAPVIPKTIAVAAHATRARLLDYGGSGPPVVFVPSLINPPTILDITPGRSLLNWLRANGVHPYLVDWGDVSAADSGVSISDYVIDELVPLLQGLRIPVQLAGYCLGGTMALAAALLHPVRALALIATPWHFARYPDAARTAMARLWSDAAPIARQLGYLPMEMLQLMFWQLDPAGTVQKYGRFATMAPDCEEAALFIAMEQWANGGAPLSYAAARELFEDLIAADFPGNGLWNVGGRSMLPAALDCRAIEIVSSTDRIVPAATASGISNRLDLDSGHVGMITGSRARAQLWEPLHDWLMRQA
jgi:polyhydroxyalkanoate synthase